MPGQYIRECNFVGWLSGGLAAYELGSYHESNRRALHKMRRPSDNLWLDKLVPSVDWLISLTVYATHEHATSPLGTMAEQMFIAIRIKLLFLVVFSWSKCICRRFPSHAMIELIFVSIALIRAPNRIHFPFVLWQFNSVKCVNNGRESFGAS